MYGKDMKERERNMIEDCEISIARGGELDPKRTYDAFYFMKEYYRKRRAAQSRN